MTKFILVGGRIYKAADGGKAFYEEVIKGISHKPIKILDCLFARPKETWEQKFNDDKKFFSEHIDSFELELAQPEKFVEQIKRSDVVFLQGGETYLIYEMLNRIGGWKEALENKTIAASSAGGDMLANYYYVGKTMRVGEGFGLLPIKFIPHWLSLDDEEGASDWNKAFEELQAYKEALDIVSLKDGEFKVIEK